MTPIAWMRSPWQEKFGVPRQPGLIREAVGEVQFAPEYADPAAREGLEGFSHLWVSFQFHLVGKEEERLRVRPPRLGGNAKLGVFATRSPFRPNRLGLSVCEIESVFPVLRLRGVDLVDGTPIYDLRPYLPFVDAIPTARGGFAQEAPGEMAVALDDKLRPRWESLPADTRAIITGMIALNPKPAFHKDGERIYSARVAGLEVSWRLAGDGAILLSLE